MENLSEITEGNNTNTLLVAVVDEQIEKLSNMQIELLTTEGFSSDDYNEISEMIGNLKEYMLNSRSYNGN